MEILTDNVALFANIFTRDIYVHLRLLLRGFKVRSRKANEKLNVSEEQRFSVNT